MSDLTVILPCAGKGSRLGLPFSKEIYSVEKDKSLIDYTFDLFKDFGRKDIHFIVTINESKLDLVEYLKKYKDRYNITFTFFNPNEKEYTGSIKSAKHLFGEKNLVLLPDSFFTLKKTQNLLDITSNSLNETGFTFFFKKEKSESMLCTKGALIISKDNLVLDYEDKPQENIARFNAFWGSFAFRKRTFDTCIEFMEKSTLNHNIKLDEIKNTPIYLSKGIEINEYYDLGTWQEIYKFIKIKHAITFN